MYLVFGQFWNQTNQSWQWQQIGGTPTNREDANSFAYGFACNYNVVTKVVSREGTSMYLPPVVDEGQHLTWPEIHPEMMVQTGISAH